MGHWYVIRTNIKCEYKALRELQDAGFEAYLPECKIERFNRRRRVRVISTLCLLPRYLFVRVGDGASWRKLRSCNGVEDVLPGGDRPAEPVRDRVDADGVVFNPVDRMQDWQADMAFDDTDAARRHRGVTVKNTIEALRKRLHHKRVRITDGPFASFPGVVDHVESLDRLQVLISIFGRPTTLHLEMGQIEELAQGREAA